MTLKSAISIATVLVSLPAAAVQVNPYTFDDPAVLQRPDVGPLWNAMTLNVTPEQAAGLSTVRAADANVTFFTEIAQFYEAGAAARGQANNSVLPESPACGLHAAIQVPPVCGGLGQQAAQLAAEARGVCLSIAEPERRIIGKQKPGDVNFTKFTNLNNLIITVTEPLMRIGLPASLNTMESRVQFRNVLSKIWKSELDGDLNKWILKYKNLSKDVSRSGCGERAQLEGSLNALADELRAIRSNLETLEQTGLKQAASEKRNVERAGRSRNALPYPSLTDKDREFITTWIGGLYWRARGGGILEEPKGTQATRVYFTLMTMQVLGHLNGGEDGARAGESLFFDLFAPWGREMDMGRANGDRHSDAVKMSQRGIQQISTAKKILLDRGYDSSDLTLGAVQMGPCYYYAWDRLIDVKVGGELRPPLYNTWMTEPTEWGEVCTGAVLSLGLSRSLLKGTSRSSIAGHDR